MTVNGVTTEVGVRPEIGAFTVLNPVGDLREVNHATANANRFSRCHPPCDEPRGPARVSWDALAHRTGGIREIGAVPGKQKRGQPIDGIIVLAAGALTHGVVEGEAEDLDEFTRLEVAWPESLQSPQENRGRAGKRGPT